MEVAQDYNNGGERGEKLVQEKWGRSPFYRGPQKVAVGEKRPQPRQPGLGPACTRLGWQGIKQRAESDVGSECQQGSRPAPVGHPSQPAWSRPGPVTQREVGREAARTSRPRPRIGFLAS